MAAAPQGGPSVVHVYDLGAGSSRDIYPYPGASGGVAVAFGDTDGDMEDDLLTGAGPVGSNGPHVRAFRLSGAAIAKVSFYAYATLKYGVNVGGGDVDDALTVEDEIVTGPGPGAMFGPHVRAFKLTPTGVVGISKASFYAYGALRYGVRVGAGDFDGEGHDDILTIPAIFSGVAQLRGFSFSTGTIQLLWDTPPGSYPGNAGAGDVDGAGGVELLTAPGPYAAFNAQVRGFEYDGARGLTAIATINFVPFTSLYGANVSSGNLDTDGYAEILASSGPDPASFGMLRGFNYDGTSITSMAGINFIVCTAPCYGLNHAASDEP